MKTTVWVIVILASLIGALETFFGLVGATGAPQQAAAAAMGMAWAVIPYCIARAVTELLSPK